LFLVLLCFTAAILLQIAWSENGRSTKNKKNAACLEKVSIIASMQIVGKGM